MLAEALLLLVAASPEQLYREAVTLYERGDVAAAAAKYEELIALRPGSAQARTNLGVALARLGRFDAAVEQYRAALRLQPGNAAIRRNLALAYYKQGRIAEAAGEIEPVASEEQNRLLLADCWLRLGRNAEVIRLLEGSSGRAADYLLGMALLRDGQIERGQRVIDRILRDGDSAEARLLLASAQFAGDEYEAALASVRQALELNPGLPGAHTMLGRILIETRDNSGAMAALQRALEGDANDFEAHLYLGALLRLDADTTGAERHVRRALELRPGSLRARFQLAAIDAAAGRTAPAAREFESIVAEAPDFQEAHVQLAALYYRLGRREDGERERAIVLKLNEKARRQREAAR